MKRFLWCVWALATSAAYAQDNKLTAAEEKAGWKLLFDGTSLTGWHKYNAGKPGDGWKVADGTFFLDPSIKDGGGDVVTDAEYENYEFSIDWKIEPCGNSGIIFNVVEKPTYKYVWLTGPEMQVLDNCHPDGKIAKHRAGNLYDLIASSTETVKPGGEWNTARIVIHHGNLQLWLNGVKQVETTMFDSNWEAMIKASKFKDMPDFGKARKGKIALQDHGNKIWFKNAKIRVL